MAVLNLSKDAIATTTDSFLSVSIAMHFFYKRRREIVIIPKIIFKLLDRLAGL